MNRQKCDIWFNCNKHSRRVNVRPMGCVPASSDTLSNRVLFVLQEVWTAPSGELMTQSTQYSTHKMAVWYWVRAKLSPLPHIYCQEQNSLWWPPGLQYCLADRYGAGHNNCWLVVVTKLCVVSECLMYVSGLAGNSAYLMIALQPHSHWQQLQSSPFRGGAATTSAHTSQWWETIMRVIWGLLALWRTIITNLLSEIFQMWSTTCCLSHLPVCEFFCKIFTQFCLDDCRVRAMIQGWWCIQGGWKLAIQRKYVHQSFYKITIAFAPDQLEYYCQAICTSKPAL